MTADKFADLGLSNDVLKGIRSIGWTEPTPVQVAAVPVGLKGDDLFAQAQTGTGKTGTYGSIILSRMKAGAVLPTTLILTPTRELALQVCEELEKLSKYTGHRTLAIYGGVSIENQIRELRKGVDIAVGTPGRMKDLLERKALSLTDIAIVVLDEADRMLDMGFAPDVNFILSKVPNKRQTMMFSATTTDDVKKFALKHMINYKELLVSKDELTLDLTSQYFVMTTRESKRDELVHLIEDGYPKIVVFCRTKRKVDYLTRKLKRDQYSVGAIHGDMAQNKREKVIKGFADGDVEVLIASDVAARGLDFEGVDIVVNYDIPVEAESYVHRIGRTGRAGHLGKAVTFVMADDIPELNAIEKKVGRKIIELDPTSPAYTEEQIVDPKKKAKQAKQQEAAKKTAAAVAIQAQEKVALSKQSRPSRLPKAAAAPAEAAAESSAAGRSLRGKLSRKDVAPAEGESQSVRRGRQRGQSRLSKVAAPAENGQPRPLREQRLSDRPGSARNGGGRSPQYPKPQGIPAHPKPVHAYVQIEKAPPKEEDLSFDRLEISIGAKDGVTPDSMAKFIIKTAGIGAKDLGNVHVYDDKSRVQVHKSKAQEVVDEVFGQTYKGRRVMVYNLSDKQ